MMEEGRRRGGTRVPELNIYFSNSATGAVSGRNLFPSSKIHRLSALSTAVT
jgi:hypothetical protein